LQPIRSIHASAYSGSNKPPATSQQELNQNRKDVIRL
jgi:hypothetical protein